MAKHDENPMRPLLIPSFFLIAAVVLYLGWRPTSDPVQPPGQLIEAETAATPAPVAMTAASSDSDTAPAAVLESGTAPAAASDSDTASAAAPESDTAPAAAPESDTASAAAPESNTVSAAAPESDTAPAAAPESDTAPAAAPESNTASAAAPESNTVSAAAPESDTAPAAAPESNAAPAAAPESDIAPAAEPVASPSFDVVRISPEGNAVIAGRAEPGGVVDILEGGVVIATVTADARGEWVALPDKPIDEGSRQLALIQHTSDGETMEGESVVVVVVPEHTNDGEAENKTALVVLMPSDETASITLLQEPAAGVGIKGSDNLSLDTIEYDDTGAFSLGGRDDAGSLIKVYINNKFIGAAEADEKGEWRITPSESVTPGLHTLRVDQTDTDGKVIARLETPFSRADFLQPTETAALVVVQPGNSLWRIARRRYGLGLQYVEIFEANRDQITDPDLIYPGQIFELPSLN